VTRTRSNRTGRNDPCPCGSGQKYKRCHGAIDGASAKPREPSDEWIHAQLAKRKANELRRESIQGLGKPIIGAKMKGYQLVAVGNTVHWGNWNTFFEFLE